MSATAQIVNYRENQAASYAAVLARAREADDRRTLAALGALGPPPWQNPRNFGVLRRVIRAYEARVSTAASGSWWVRSGDDDTPPMIADDAAGEDFSFLQFVGLRGDGMFSRVDLPSLGMAFEMPVFLVHGSEDLLATPEVALRYFNGITAPEKAFVLVPRAGHDPNAASSMPSTAY